MRVLFSSQRLTLYIETRSNDGRALCGAGHGRVYMGTNNGIYVIDTDNCRIIGKVGSEILDEEDDGKPNTDPSGSLYSGQIGDKGVMRVLFSSQRLTLYIVAI